MSLDVREELIVYEIAPEDNDFLKEILFHEVNLDNELIMNFSVNQQGLFLLSNKEH